HSRHHVRRPYRRRLLAGSAHVGHRPAMDAAYRGRADHRRRRHRPVDQEGLGMNRQAAPAKREPILKATALVKRFGRVVALNRADFDLYPGEILAVIGDNGAGKTTLIKAISGAITPDAGEILLEGKPV